MTCYEEAGQLGQLIPELGAGVWVAAEHVGAEVNLTAIA
jgi:hypothetical protein